MSEALAIPRLIHHIWIGPRPAPLHWMETWRAHHPDWDYRLWGDAEIFGRRFVNQNHINFYLQRKNWQGAADVARYEILHEQGGLMPGADSECLMPCGELFDDPSFDAYAVYENEQATPGLVTPLYACAPGSEFAAALIAGLQAKERVGEPWQTTGNQFMRDTIARGPWPRLKLWPSHYFNPVHHTGLRYDGNGPVYATQHWGTTRNAYAAS